MDFLFSSEKPGFYGFTNNKLFWDPEDHIRFETDVSFEKQFYLRGNCGSIYFRWHKVLDAMSNFLLFWSLLFFVFRSINVT